jgi:hypothetical protein
VRADDASRLLVLHSTPIQTMIELGPAAAAVAIHRRLTPVTM